MKLWSKSRIRQLFYWGIRIFEWPLDTLNRHVRIRFLMATRTPDEVVAILKSELSDETKQSLHRMSLAGQAMQAIARTKFLHVEELSVYRTLMNLSHGRFCKSPPEEEDRILKIVLDTQAIPDSEVIKETVMLCVELDMLNPSELLTVQEILKQQNIALDLGQSMTLTVK